MFAVTFALVETLTTGPNRKIYADYWQRALVMATASSRFAVLCTNVVHDDAYTAGLLADMGLLLLAQLRHDDYMPIYETVLHGPELLEAEESLFEFNHAQLGVHLLRQWELPDWVVEAVENHHKPPAASQRLPLAVYAGNVMAGLLLCPETEPLPDSVRFLQDQFRFAEGGLLELANGCLLDVQEIADLFNIRLHGFDDSTIESLENLIVAANGAASQPVSAYGARPE